jgi:hypothetical protein
VMDGRQSEQRLAMRWQDRSNAGILDLPSPSVLCLRASSEQRRISIRWRPTMAYAIMHQFPGGTKDQYEKSLAAVHPSKSSLPAGQIFHAAGPSAGGWTIMAVHDH